MLENKILEKEPTPWFTNESIKFIIENIKDTDTVLEFGGGFSSIWWAKKCKFTLTVEASYEWASKLLLEFSKYPEALTKWQLKFVASDWNPTIDHPKNYWKKNKNILNEIIVSEMNDRYLSIDFDPNIIIIDGSIRPLNIQKVNEYLKTNTSVRIIIVDNMESLGKHTINMFEGFKQYDFHETNETLIPEHQNGKWCTSVWIKE